MKKNTPPKKHKGRSNAQKNTNLVWGVHPVTELLQSEPQRIIELRILKQKQSAKLQEIINLAESKGVAIARTDVPFAGLSQRDNHQGVIAKVKPIPTISLDELLQQTAASPHPPLLIALDTIQDPHNLGSIIRSASAAGVQGIIFPKDRSAPLSGTVAKVSVGAINKMPLCQVTNMANALKQLREEGFWIYGADGTAKKNIYQTKFSGALCLVIGGEEKGIRPLVKTQCDELVAIPMHSDLESLNASVAAAVMMFEIVRQRISEP